MPINPNTAFTRVIFDLPTPVAIQLDEVVKASGKSKKKFLEELISSTLQASQPTKTKGKK